MLAHATVRKQTKAAPHPANVSARASVTLAPPRLGHADEARAQPSWDFAELPLFSPDRAAATPQPGILQAKLAVGPVDDPLERQADRVADQVMRMPEPEIQSQQPRVPALLNRIDSGKTIRRLASDRDPSLEDIVIVEGGDENDSKQGQVQTLRSAARTSGREAISKDLLRSPQGGVPLGANVKQFMESRFGADFSSVQIHADGHAEALSKTLFARAFTYGRHIYFNEGEYQPETQDGRRVLAHELAHVIQQGGSQTLPGQHHSREANVSPAIQRLGKLGKELQHGVAPWGSGGPTGSNYEVSTDGGTIVPAWSAYYVFQDQFRYWCHGHSLGTYDMYDYSVYSGPPMQAVVRDEWTNVASDQTKPGDIAVWTANFDHSAKFTKPVIENGQLVPDKSELSTKNGQAALAVKTLTSIMGTYGSKGVAVYRHK